MEVIELTSYHLNYFSNVLEVSFRMNMDTEDEIRNDKIYFDNIRDFGFDFIPHSQIEYNLNSDYYDENNYIDEEQILSFLNEYYIVFPKKLPKTEFY